MRQPSLLLSIILALVPSQVAGQDAPPQELQHLDMWVGDWTYTISSEEPTGTMSFQWFGDRLLRAEEHTPNGWEVIHVMRYDPEEGVYVWNRFWNSGYVDESQGWFQDGTWTFLFMSQIGDIRRMTMDFETTEVINFKWERSVEGGPWELMSEGTTTRAN
jgi:hypothetical protein